MIFNSFIRAHFEYSISSLTPKGFGYSGTYPMASHEIKFEPYEERLQPLNLYRLQYMNLGGDLLIAYIILNTSEHPLKHLPRLSSNTILRGNTKKTGNTTQQNGLKTHLLPPKSSQMLE